MNNKYLPLLQNNIYSTLYIFKVFLVISHFPPQNLPYVEKTGIISI